MLEEAIAEKAKIKTIVICEECIEQNSIDKKLLYEMAKYSCLYVSKKVLDSLTDVSNPQGVLAVIDKKEGSKKIDYSQEVLLILDGIQDPGNLGTILRTADSVGLKQIIVSANSGDIYNPKVVRSTMGAIFRVEVIESKNLQETLKEIKANKFQIAATDLHTNKNIYQIDYNKTAIIIGNEANGVSKELLQQSDYRIRIPMLGKTESLNASVATGIILYEYVRRKIN